MYLKLYVVEITGYHQEDFSSIYTPENRLANKPSQHELSEIIEIKNSSEVNIFILILYTDIHKLIDKGTQR